MKNEDAITYWESLKKEYAENVDQFESESIKQHFKKAIEAIDAALSSLRSAGECDQNATEMRPDSNTPLTIEQLREMGGNPVWVHVIDHTVFADKEDDFDGWGMCRKSWVRVWDRKRADLVHIDYDFEDYGKNWLAYADHPAHIDREEWEPCGNCAPSCGNCISGDEYQDDCPLECQCCVNHNNYRPKDKYCSVCGRPLTPAAWADLEKRLRG